jgi:hypothetical protein
LSVASSGGIGRSRNRKILSKTVAFEEQAVSGHRFDMLRSADQCDSGASAREHAPEVTADSARTHYSYRWPLVFFHDTSEILTVAAELIFYSKAKSRKPRALPFIQNTSFKPN